MISGFFNYLRLARLMPCVPRVTRHCILVVSGEQGSLSIYACRKARIPLAIAGRVVAESFTSNRDQFAVGFYNQIVQEIANHRSPV